MNFDVVMKLSKAMISITLKPLYVPLLCFTKMGFFFSIFPFPLRNLLRGKCKLGITIWFLINRRWNASNASKAYSSYYWSHVINFWFSRRTALEVLVQRSVAFVIHKIHIPQCQSFSDSINAVNMDQYNSRSLMLVFLPVWFSGPAMGFAGRTLAIHLIISTILICIHNKRYAFRWRSNDLSTHLFQFFVFLAKLR